MRTVDADSNAKRGRLAKAKQFQQVVADALTLVQDGENIADAVVTLCVHAGIAASDAICAAKLGKYARGIDHKDAVSLLATVDKRAANYLSTLLAMKTKAGYDYRPVSATELSRAIRAMDALVDLATIQASR